MTEETSFVLIILWHYFTHKRNYHLASLISFTCYWTRKHSLEVEYL